MKASDVAGLYRNLGLVPPSDIADPRERRSKYGAKRKGVDGHVFASSGEASCYKCLKLMACSGAISDLKLQPRFVLIPKSVVQRREVVYVADFSFIRDGKLVVVDYKGFETPVFRIKKALFLERYPDLVFEVWTKETVRQFMRGA